MLKMPRDLIDLKLAGSYCGDQLDIYMNCDDAILDFIYYNDGHRGDYTDEAVMA